MNSTTDGHSEGGKFEKNLNPLSCEVIYNLFNYFVAEKNHQHKNSIYSKVSDYLRLSKGTVVSVVKSLSTILPINKKIKKRKLKKKFNQSDINIVRIKLGLDLVLNNSLPLLPKLKTIIHDKEIFKAQDVPIPELLTKLEFNKIKNNNYDEFYIENSKISFERHKFLSAVRSYRQAGRPVVYLDEYYVIGDNSDHFLTLLHAASYSGFLDNTLLIYKSNRKDKVMSMARFDQWVTERLLPNLPPKSIVVMDNAKCHCSERDRKPNINSTRKEMQDWLLRKGRLCPPNLLRCKLLEIIKNISHKKCYTVDEVLAEHGHKVLRLPKNHCALNPFHIFWQEIAVIIDKRPLDEMKYGLVEFVHNFPEHKWMEYESVVLGYERDYMTIDRGIDMASEEIVKANGENILSTAECNSESEVDSDCESLSQNRSSQIEIVPF